MRCEDRPLGHSPRGGRTRSGPHGEDGRRTLGGGRIWWAHFEFTRLNITPTILPKKIEDLRQLGAFRGLVRSNRGGLVNPTALPGD